MTSYGGFMSRHAPMLWRTNMPPLVVGSVMLTGLVLVLGRTIHLTPTNMPGLTVSVFAISLVASLALFLIALVTFDQVRRLGFLYRSRHVLLAAACVAISTAALLLPFQIFVRSALWQIASAESRQSIERLQTWHGSWRYWRCISSEQREAALRELSHHREQMTADLARYGFVTDFDFSEARNWWRSCREGRYRVVEPYDLHVWRVDADHRIQAADKAIEFEQRIENVANAKAYFGASGVYRESLLAVVLTPWGVFGLAVLAASVVGCTSTRWRWMSLFAHAFPRIRRIHMPVDIVRRPDAYLVRNWPTLWSAHVHSSVFEVGLVVLAIYFLVMEAEDDSSLILSWIVITVLVTLRQQFARATTTFWRQDLIVLIIHLSLASAIATYFLWDTLDSSQDIAITFVMCLVLALVVHTARTLPVLYAMVAFWSVVVMFFGFMTTLQTFVETVSDSVAAMVLLSLPLCAAGCAWLVERREGPVSIAATLWASFVSTSPAIGWAVVYAAAVMANSSAKVSVDSHPVLVMAATFTSAIIAMSTTQNRRRRLALLV